VLQIWSVQYYGLTLFQAQTNRTTKTISLWCRFFGPGRACAHRIALTSFSLPLASQRFVSSACTAPFRIFQKHALLTGSHGHTAIAALSGWAQLKPGLFTPYAPAQTRGRCWYATYFGCFRKKETVPRCNEGKIDYRCSPTREKRR
jgi:hypothetical protein